METFDALRTVLAVRRFRDAPIPDDVVREIVEAAHLTGRKQRKPLGEVASSERYGRPFA